MSDNKDEVSKDVGKWSLALDQLIEALRLLDGSDAPPEIGARLDHAIHALQDAIDRESAN